MEESKTDKNVFDEIENKDTAKIEQEIPAAPAVDMKPSVEEDNALVEEVDSEEKPFEAKISDKSQEQIEVERGVKKKADKRTLTIEKVFITSPKTDKMVDGVKKPVPPKTTQNENGLYYAVKLAIRFKEENIVEYYPGLRVWVNDGQLNPNIRIDRKGAGKVTQIFRLAINHMAGNKFKLVNKKINDKDVISVADSDQKEFEAYERTISDQAFYSYLVGKKVLIETTEGIYNGKNWFRNDITKIL